MDTLQASHATSSSFRSAPQSTAVASTRGNIVVPPKREIHGPGEPSTGLIRDGSPHRKQPPKREIHGPGEPSTGRYKYDHPGYQSTGQSHMPLPKRPHRSPNSDANKTCPVPGFARDVVTVRSAVDLLGGGYRPVQISWKRFRSAVLRGTGRPGEEGRGENPAPLLYLEIVGTPESEYGKRRAPKGSGRRQHHRPTSAAGCRDRDSAGAPLFRFLRRYGESCASSERRDREPAAWTGPASGRDPGSAGAPPLPLRRNTTLERTERVVRRRNEETANPPPGPDRRVVVTPAPPEHHLSRCDATPLSRGTERVVRRRNEETANPPPGPDRRVVVTPAPPEHHLSRYDATPLSRGTERVVRRRNEETANPPPGPDRRVVVTPAPPEHHLSRSNATPLSRGTEKVVRRRNEETANPPPGPDRRVVVTPAPPEHHLSRSNATPLSRGTERVVRRRNEETANPPLQNQRRAVVTPTPPEHDAFRFAPRHRPEGCPGGTQGPRARRRVPGGPPRVTPKREKEARERSSEDRRHHSCTRTPPREREESSCRTSEVQLDRAHTSPYRGQLACQLSWKRSSSPVRCGMMLADGEGRGQNLVQFLRQNVGPKIHFSRKNGNFQRTLDRPRATSFSDHSPNFGVLGPFLGELISGVPKLQKFVTREPKGISARNRYRGRGPGISFPRFDLGALPPRGSPGGPFRKTFFFLPFSPLNPKPEPPRTSFWYGSKGQVAGLPKKIFLKNWLLRGPRGGGP
ncbi:hypothetical protein TNCT_488751 [Trichonephila clavata]|uniref:Uncharacterized protein n=1 Tax=Trichonephila clavata TaxID=2740835 RepID=A0A8X6GI45_TRICU|nr:hypothetical protein TNCT_488751 [Trichonephila clavata]